MSDEPRWRLLLRRAVIVGASSLLSVAILGLLAAWLALRIPWEVPTPEQLSGPTEVLARDGTVIARFTSEVDREVVPLDEVSQAMRDAVVAAEDERFRQHSGVDPLSLVRAVVTNVRTGGITQGGSTLTQQYVKNAYVGADRTLLRKVREAVISIQLERRLSKDQILERYLNTVYFGEGAYGVEAAALTYFDVPASRLSPAQAALLAQALPAPSELNPRVDPQGAAQRADGVIDTMERLDLLDAEAATRARTAAPEVQPRRGEQVLAAPYFVAYVRSQLEAAYGQQEVLTGALTVRTTLDLDAHRDLREGVLSNLPPESEHPDVDAGAAAVDPETGDILALYGGRSFARRQFNTATQLRGRQPGSSLKPFVYARALQEGIPPTEVYPAPATVRPRDCPPAADGTNPFREPVANAGGRGFGALPLESALANSVNTVFVQLGCDVGPEDVVETARLMGVRNPVTPTANVSIGGGPDGPSPLDLASAFGTLANDGLSCPARSILAVTERDGTQRPPPPEVVPIGEQPIPRTPTGDELATRPEGLAELDEGRCHQAIHPDVARTTTQALEIVVAETTGTRAQIGRPQAGKTGTTNNETDAWFTGYTPALSLSVWVGRPDCGDPEDPACQLTDIAGFSRLFGGTLPAVIWADAATDLLADVPPTDFPEPGALPGTEDVVGPARERPRPAPAPTPSASPGPGGDSGPGDPDDDPDADPGGDDPPSPSPSPSPSPDADPDGCIPLLQDCSGRGADAR